MARLLTDMEKGDYFDQTGNIKRNLPIDYMKAQSWELRPTTKAPPELENDNMNTSNLDTSRQESGRDIESGAAAQEESKQP